MGQELATVLPSADHPQRAEKADPVVEHTVAKTVQFDEVRAKSHYFQVVDFRLLPHDPQHVVRKIDAERSETAASQRDQGPARAAAEIGHQAGPGEMAGDDLFVELEELVEGEVVGRIPWRCSRCGSTPRHRGGPPWGVAIVDERRGACELLVGPETRRFARQTHTREVLVASNFHQYNAGFLVMGAWRHVVFRAARAAFGRLGSRLDESPGRSATKAVLLPLQ